jgi:hypothetical protein
MTGMLGPFTLWGGHGGGGGGGEWFEFRRRGLLSPEASWYKACMVGLRIARLAS